MAGEGKTLITLGVVSVGGYFLGEWLGWWGTTTPAVAATPTAPAASAIPTTSPSPPAPTAGSTPTTFTPPAGPPACTTTQSAQMLALASALQTAAVSGGYGTPPFTVSQWNWVLNNIVAPGSNAAQLPAYGNNLIDAPTYVCALVQAGIALPAPVTPPAGSGFSSSSGSTSNTPTTASPVPNSTAQKIVLSAALQNWATQNGYGSQLNISQWNYILNAVNPGGAPPLMSDPTNGGTMTAAQYVQALTSDPAYTMYLTSISPNFAGMSGYRGMGVMTRANRRNYVRKPVFA